jgi:hypothetical protein
MSNSFRWLVCLAHKLMTNNKKKQQFDFEVEVGGKNVGYQLLYQSFLVKWNITRIAFEILCVFFSLSRCFGIPNLMRLLLDLIRCFNWIRWRIVLFCLSPCIIIIDCTLHHHKTILFSTQWIGRSGKRFGCRGQMSDYMYRENSVGGIIHLVYSTSSSIEISHCQQR